MSRMIKFFWFLSILVFLFVLMMVYAHLPEPVVVEVDQYGVPAEMMGRSSFFYLAIGIFLLANASLMVLRKLLQKTWLVEGSGGARVPGRLSLRREVTDWLLALASSLNFFFVLGMIYIGAFNNPEGMDLGSFWPLVYLGPLLIGLVFIALIYILIKKRPA